MTALVTTDNKDQDSRLPDYALKISRVFIHICLFIPLISNNFEAETGHLSALVTLN